MHFSKDVSGETTKTADVIETLQNVSGETIREDHAMHFLKDVPCQTAIFSFDAMRLGR